MSKWYDANGTDVDAYPNDAFQGGVYTRPVKTNENNDRKSKDKTPKVDDGRATPKIGDAI